MIPQKKRIKQLRESGVEICGNDVYIGENVSAERGVLICSPCHITGETHLCAGARILPFSYLDNAVVGERSTVSASTIKDSAVGSDTTVGPYAYLRDGTKVGTHCRVGDFVEIKNSTVADGSKIAHLAYVGDAEIGARVNVGCGVVFANYNGKVKRASVVGDDCFIGCNCNIVAPVHIGNGAYVAAGTTVCCDLEKGDFCIGRSREKIIPNGGAGRYSDG